MMLESGAARSASSSLEAIPIALLRMDRIFREDDACEPAPSATYIAAFEAPMLICAAVAIASSLASKEMQ